MKSSISDIKNRRDRIIEYLTVHTQASIQDLSSYLNISPITIRRDLTFLEEKGVISRFHGGASLPTETDSKKTFVTGLESLSKTDHSRETVQRALARHAASLIHSGDILFINSSKTASYIVEYLSDKRVSIITNNLYILLRNVSPQASVVFTGGQYHIGQSSLTGGVTINEIGRLIANKCFLGVSAISADGGITSPFLEESYANAAMIQQTDGEVIVLAEGFKVGKNDRFQISGFSKVNLLITDDSADTEEQANLKSCGMQITTVNISHP